MNRRSFIGGSLAAALLARPRLTAATPPEASAAKGLLVKAGADRFDRPIALRMPIFNVSPAGQLEAFFNAQAAFTRPPSRSELEALFEAHGMKMVGDPLPV